MGLWGEECGLLAVFVAVVVLVAGLRRAGKEEGHCLSGELVWCASRVGCESCVRVLEL